MTETNRVTHKGFESPLASALAVIATIFGILLLLWLILFITKGRFLKEPFERIASAEVGRPVTVGGDFQLYSDPHIRFLAEDLVVRNPDWAVTEDFVDARLVDLRIDLLSLIFGDMLFRSVTLHGATFGLESNEDGTQNTWTFGEPTGEPFELPAIRRASIRDTELVFRDPVMELFTTIRFAPARARDSRFGEAIGFAGEGRSRGAPFKLTGRLESPDETIAGGRNQLRARIDVGDSRVDVAGTLRGATELEGADLNIRGRGANLMTPFRLLGIVVPQTRRYDLRGNLTKAGDEWRVSDISGTFGDSDLAGGMTVDTGGERLFLSANLSSERLDIIDAGPWIGLNPERIAAEGASGAVKQEGGRPRLLPDAPLNSEGLSRLDVDLSYRAAEVRTGTVPIADLQLELGLDNRRLTLAPVSFDFAGGTLTANIDLNARQSPVETRYDVSLSPVRLADLMRGFDIEGTGTTGRMRMRIEMTGYGDSVRESLGTADGRAAFIFPQGTLWLRNAELLELDIGDFIEAAIGDDLKAPAEIRCGILAFTLEDGVGRADPIFIDTEKAVLRGGGTISLKDESLNLALEADSKNFSLFSGQSPIGVQGYLAEPSINPVSGELVQRIAAGGALGVLLSPVAALAAFVDLGDEEDTNCTPVLAGARSEAVAAADEAAEED